MATSGGGEGQKDGSRRREPPTVTDPRGPDSGGGLLLFLGPVSLRFPSQTRSTRKNDTKMGAVNKAPVSNHS